MGNSRGSTVYPLPRGRSIESLWRHYYACQHSFPDHAFSRRVFRSPEEDFAEDHSRGLLIPETLTYRSKFMRMRIQSNDPFPSSPTRPATHVIRFCSGANLAIHGFCQAAPAKAMIDGVLKSASIKWVNNYAIYCEALDMTISSHRLEEIMECTEPFDLPIPYPRMISTIRNEAIDVSPLLKSKPEPPKPARTVTSKDSSLITIGEIASQMGIESSSARAALRKANTPKPAHGWAWALSEVESIKVIIKRGLK